MQHQKNLMDILLNRKTPINKMVMEELYQAQVSLLNAQSALEYTQAQIDYQEKRVKRLQQYLDSQMKGTNEAFNSKDPSMFKPTATSSATTTGVR